MAVEMLTGQTRGGQRGQRQPSVSAPCRQDAAGDRGKQEGIGRAIRRVRTLPRKRWSRRRYYEETRRMDKHPPPAGFAGDPQILLGEGFEFYGEGESQHERTWVLLVASANRQTDAAKCGESEEAEAKARQGGSSGGDAGIELAGASGHLACRRKQRSWTGWPVMVRVRRSLCHLQECRGRRPKARGTRAAVVPNVQCPRCDARGCTKYLAGGKRVRKILR